MRDRVKIGVTKEKIRELIQNLIFQFSWRKRGRRKRWNRSRRRRCWEGSFGGRGSYRRGDNSAHFSSHDNWCRYTTAALRNDRCTRGEKYRENREGNHFFHIGLLG